MKVVISILIIVTALMILHYILEEFNLERIVLGLFSADAIIWLASRCRFFVVGR